MNKVEYNGWTNYETWLINLHMTNEQGGTDFVMEFLDERTELKPHFIYLARFLQDTYEEDATSVLSHDLTCRTFDMNLLAERLGAHVVVLDTSEEKQDG